MFDSLIKLQCWYWFEFHRDIFCSDREMKLRGWVILERVTRVCARKQACTLFYDHLVKLMQRIMTIFLELCKEKCFLCAFHLHEFVECPGFNNFLFFAYFSFDYFGIDIVFWVVLSLCTCFLYCDILIRVGIRWVFKVLLKIIILFSQL